MDPWRQVSPRAPDGSRRRTGTFVGPVRVTPTRVFLSVALLGSLLYLGYAISVRDTSQIPALASGALVLGLVFAALATVGGIETYRSARAGRPARSFLAAIAGGVAGLVALACFAAAAILSILSRTP
ncbi:MAG: hypothetical protein P4L30_03085 [Candidatus Limnocylindrales bacterium]|jgi:EamA domain-containing membrane protein RarD|nr:hypothetical protein [Candidatus Limnocylindrales bacterium]